MLLQKHYCIALYLLPWPLFQLHWELNVHCRIEQIQFVIHIIMCVSLCYAEWRWYEICILYYDFNEREIE